MFVIEIEDKFQQLFFNEISWSDVWGEHGLWCPLQHMLCSVWADRFSHTRDWISFFYEPTWNWWEKGMKQQTRSCHQQRPTATGLADIHLAVASWWEEAEQRGLRLEDHTVCFQTGTFLFTETPPVIKMVWSVTLCSAAGSAILPTRHVSPGAYARRQQSLPWPFSVLQQDRHFLLSLVYNLGNICVRKMSQLINCLKFLRLQFF